MTFSDKLLDTTGWKILKKLQEDGRISYKELGESIGLTTPAVRERIRKLEESGMITGYRAMIDLKALGRLITAFITVVTRPESVDPLIHFTQDHPAVLEAHYVTGQASFILKISVPSIADLETFIKRLSHFGPTQTSIVMSTHVDRRLIGPDAG